MASENAKAVAREVCSICGYDRAVDHCHIFPVMIIKQLVCLFFNKKEKLNYVKGEHLLILCKNCHWAYDHFNLNKKEFDKIKNEVIVEISLFEKVMRKQVKNGMFDKKLLKDFNKWSDKFDKLVNKLYGNTTTKKAN